MGREDGSQAKGKMCTQSERQRGSGHHCAWRNAEVPATIRQLTSIFMGSWHLGLPRHLHVLGQMWVQVCGEGHWLLL